MGHQQKEAWGGEGIHLIITMIKWIRTSRSSMENYLWGGQAPSKMASMVILPVSGSESPDSPGTVSIWACNTWFRV